MESVAEIRRNRLPVRTWSWLGMNESVLKDEDAEKLSSVEREALIKVFSAQREVKESVFRFVCVSGENKVQEVELYAEEESCLTVWMDISSPRETEGLLALNTNIKAGKNAKVRLIQIQLLGTGCRFVNNIKAQCQESAGVELLQIFLGGAKTWAEFHGNLGGIKSSVSVQLGYWCRSTQRLDMNYVALHQARNTVSHLLTRGVLADEAFKLFRGTIDFRQGASGSAGEETEEVLMLGEEAVNQTIPLILCGEEDVQGNHGATIGEPDEETLFYMASRGIERQDAAALLARAKIDGLRAQIGNDELEKRVKEYLEEVMGK